MNQHAAIDVQRDTSTVEQSVRIHTEELIQATSRMFGFQRCGPDLRDVIHLALTSQLANDLVIDADGFVLKA